MNKLIIAGALAGATLATPALADFFIVREGTAACKVVETRPTDTKITVVGNKVYKTRVEAEKKSRQSANNDQLPPRPPFQGGLAVCLARKAWLGNARYACAEESEIAEIVPALGSSNSNSVNDCFWHEAYVPPCPLSRRSGRVRGSSLDTARLSQFDPEQSLIALPGIDGF